MCGLLGLASSVSHMESRSLDFLCFVCSGDKIFLGHDKVPVFPPVLIRTIENLSVWTSAISFATTHLLDIGLFVAGLTKSLSENTYCKLDSRSV